MLKDEEKLSDVLLTNNSLSVPNSTLKLQTILPSSLESEPKNPSISLMSYNKILTELNDANKKISRLQGEIKTLKGDLSKKEVKFENIFSKTEEQNLSNYEEEYDLKKILIGAAEQNNTEDINIDYPGIQGLQEKFSETKKKYDTIVEQIKSFLSQLTINMKIKPYVSQICQIIGFSPEQINLIVTNSKNKKEILLGKK